MQLLDLSTVEMSSQVSSKTLLNSRSGNAILAETLFGERRLRGAVGILKRSSPSGNGSGEGGGYDS